MVRLHGLVADRTCPMRNSCEEMMDYRVDCEYSRTCLGICALGAVYIFCRRRLPRLGPVPAMREGMLTRESPGIKTPETKQFPCRSGCRTTTWCEIKHLSGFMGANNITRYRSNSATNVMSVTNTIAELRLGPIKKDAQ